MDQSIQPGASSATEAKSTPQVTPAAPAPIAPMVKPALPPVTPAAAQAAPQVTARRRAGWMRGGLRGVLRPRYLVSAVLVLIGLAYGGREIWFRFTHVYEYDARVTADVVTMSSRVEGWITEMTTLEGTRVEQGQVVVRIDDRVSRLRRDSLRAQLDGIQSDRERLKAERDVVESQSDARMRTRAQNLAASEKAISAMKSDLDLAKLEQARNISLFERRVIGERQLQQSQAAVTKLESQILQLDAERLAAEGNLEEARAERFRLAVIDHQIAGLKHQEAQVQAQLEQQTVDVEDRTIKSPVPAVITRTFMLPGEYVAPGQRILLLYNPDEVWVEANIKETQVGRLKLGQTVNVSVDAYPDQKFIGKVTRIGSATTARFALLPTPNPSGNFTKITQRVPVKINLVQMPKPLSPGMMVEVDIDVR